MSLDFCMYVTYIPREAEAGHIQGGRHASLLSVCAFAHMCWSVPI